MLTCTVCSPAHAPGIGSTCPPFTSRNEKLEFISLTPGIVRIVLRATSPKLVRSRYHLQQEVVLTRDVVAGYDLREMLHRLLDQRMSNGSSAGTPAWGWAAAALAASSRA
jgi:hypothetical protein